MPGANWKRSPRITTDTAEIPRGCRLSTKSPVAHPAMSQASLRRDRERERDMERERESDRERERDRDIADRGIHKVRRTKTQPHAHTEACTRILPCLSLYIHMQVPMSLHSCKTN